MGDVNLEIKLSNLDERVIKIEESGGGSGGDGYITSVSNDFTVVNKKLSLSNDVTTKLSNVDNKIDKPVSATDGQVLTYNGTSNEWEAKNPSASITEPTELEKGIVGGDEWTAKSYTAGSTVIYNNKIYSCIADCGASNPPTDTTYWEETSLSALNSKLNSSEEGVIAHTSNITQGDINYIKWLNFVFISFVGKTTNMSAGWYDLSANNPFPPKSRLVFTSNVVGKIADVSFETNGAIKIYPYGGVTVGNTVTFICTYMI